MSMRSFRKTAKASLEQLRSCVTGEAAALGPKRTNVLLRHSTPATVSISSVER